MTLRALVVSIVVVLVVMILLAVKMNAPVPRRDAPVLARVNGCEVTVDEFESGFAASAFSSRDDKLQARREYLETLVNQKLILLDAQKKGFDKAPDFLESVEKFWAQSLLTVALGKKTFELHKTVNVRDEDIHRIYEEMLQEGVTAKALPDVYPQIKWQAQKQSEAQMLGIWIESLRKDMVVSVDENTLKSLK